MEEFKSKMLRVNDGEATTLTPVEFTGRVKERKLERWLIEDPELSGEPLLVLGSQLAEFAEDKDRLDVLALDKSGEVVLLELKVDGAFRVTDLQALAYAAGYSALPPEHFARVLQDRWEQEGGSDATVDQAKDKITEFVDVLDEFDEWRPSKRVRIKLIAPGFPKRVLHTVKWLGDVYGMPIEAIQVQLFEDAPEHYQLTFERLLPLKSDDAFDLTVKAAEAQAVIEKQKKPAILKTLLENGIIEDGQELWFHPSKLPPDKKDLFDPENVAFRAVLDTSTGKPMFRWRESPEAPEQLIAPSMCWFYVYGAVLPGLYTTPSGSPVFNHYSLEPGGPTLEEIAADAGVW